MAVAVMIAVAAAAVVVAVTATGGVTTTIVSDTKGDEGTGGSRCELCSDQGLSFFRIYK
jgi:hypothetical protein